MVKQKEAVEASQSYNRLYFLTPSVISQRYKKYVAILVSNVHKRTKTEGDRTVFAISQYTRANAAGYSHPPSMATIEQPLCLMTVISFVQDSVGMQRFKITSRKEKKILQARILRMFKADTPITMVTIVLQSTAGIHVNKAWKVTLDNRMSLVETGRLLVTHRCFPSNEIVQPPIKLLGIRKKNTPKINASVKEGATNGNI